MRGNHLIIALIATAACSPSPAADIAVARDTLGDTILVTVVAPMTLADRRWEADSVRPLFTPTDMRRIVAVSHHRGTVYLTDGSTVIGWRAGTGEGSPIGTNGAGPGEYRRVAAMSVGQDGTLHLLDESQSKIVSFDSGGTALRDTLIDASWGAGAGLLGLAAFPDGGWITATDRDMVDPGGLEDSVNVMLHRPGTPPVMLFRVADGTYLLVPPYVVERQVYGRRSKVSLSAAQGAAVSSGEDYHIWWWRPDASPAFTRITREWQRATTEGMEELPEAQRAGLGDTGPALLEALAGQELGSHKNAVEHLVLFDNGTLLVQVVDSTHRYHPTWLRRFPELRPPHYTWELFGSDGALLGQLVLPSRFRPFVWRECELLGIAADDDGVESLVSVELGEACGWVPD